MSVTPSVIDLIGDTPLVRLNRLSDETGCEILGKAEFMNPGGSIKDRAALSIVHVAFGSITVVGPDGALIGGIEERIVRDADRVAFSDGGKAVTVKRAEKGKASAA